MGKKRKSSWIELHLYDSLMMLLAVSSILLAAYSSNFDSKGNLITGNAVGDTGGIDAPCGTFYWYDNAHLFCNSSAGCGISPSPGLNTFPTMEECQSSLTALLSSPTGCASVGNLWCDSTNSCISPDQSCAPAHTIVCGDGICEGNESQSEICNSGCTDACLRACRTNPTYCPADCSITPEPTTIVICGNGVCDPTENSTSCPSDCPASLSALLGCVEDWDCTEYGACMNGTQRRTCTDRNNCGTSTNKPDVLKLCIPSSECAEDWTCGEWRECHFFTCASKTIPCPYVQNRTCKDSNKCGTQDSKPDETRECIPETGAPSPETEVQFPAPEEIDFAASDTDDAEQELSSPAPSDTNTSGFAWAIYGLIAAGIATGLVFLIKYLMKKNIPTAPVTSSMPATPSMPAIPAAPAAAGFDEMIVKIKSSLSVGDKEKAVSDYKILAESFNNSREKLAQQDAARIYQEIMSLNSELSR